MSVDNFSDHQPATLNDGEPPAADQGLPSRQILFLASGIEEALPPRLFEELGERYQAESHLPAGPESSRYLLQEGFNVIVPSLLNTAIERQPYLDAASEVAGALVVTLCLKHAGRNLDNQPSSLIEWAQDRDDNGVLTLHRRDTRFSLLMIDWHLRRRLGAYDPVIS